MPVCAPESGHAELLTIEGEGPASLAYRGTRPLGDSTTVLGALAHKNVVRSDRALLGVLQGLRSRVFAVERRLSA